MADAARGANEITGALNQVAMAADKGTHGAMVTLNSSSALTGLARELQDLLASVER